MNNFNATKRMLATCLMASLLSLVGCKADGDGTGIPGNNGNGSGITDTKNCQVPVGDTLCVLGGDDHEGGLVDVLLDKDGPLGPIAGAIDTAKLTEALTELLENDDGNLADIVQGLIEDGQLEEGLALLLQGENGNGDGALGALLGGLLLPNEAGNDLLALFGEDGIQGLVNALLVDGTSSSCQAPLGTLCLIAGDNSNQQGLVDLLITSGGALGALSPFLTEQLTDELVDALGDTLASDGSLPNLVEGLIANGQLAEGLTRLLGGNSAQPGALELLGNTAGGLGTVLNQILAYLGSVLGTTP